MRWMFSAVAIILCAGAHAAITVPGANGSDGALINVSGTKTIDLSLAANGAWDSNSPVQGSGVYDGEKGAVVFHYSSVSINAGAVVFKNHPSRAPVVWLVNGDVTINGLVNLDGGNYNSSFAPFPEPGPGGYPGGKTTLTTGVYAGPNGPGWGLGGGQRGSATGASNSAGYNGPGNGPMPGAAYGTTSLVPLVGGSGGGGSAITNAGGGAGGGAILIAATGTISLGPNGLIRANGGLGWGGANGSGGGSGGAIRLVADTISGDGTLSAAGGGGNTTAANGRIRIEGNSVSSSLDTTPLPSAAKPSNPALIFPAASAPSARIVSVGNLPAPTQPMGRLSAAADVLPDIAPATLTVLIETRNVPTSSQVNLHVTPIQSDASTIPAAFVSGDSTQATWTANVAFPPGTTGLQVRVEP